MATEKRNTTYRLSPDARRLIVHLAERDGLTETGVVERAVRALARQEYGEGWRAEVPPDAVPPEGAETGGKRVGKKRGRKPKGDKT